MPVRRENIATGEIYHLVNRGVASMPIFNTQFDYRRFMNLLEYYRYDNLTFSYSRYNDLPLDERQAFYKKLKANGKLLAEIYAYCLMPNHFHFLLRQEVEDGIKKMFSNIQNAYVKYLNLTTERSGPLFQSRYRIRRIENEESFLHVSRYIHLNPTTSYLVKVEDLLFYQWSSLPCYLKDFKSDIVNTNLILKLIGGQDKYREFVYGQVDYQRKLDRIKHLVLE